MRPIEIRGEIHDIDDLVRRGRALHGDAVRSLLAAAWRAVGRAKAGLSRWRRSRTPAPYARWPGADRTAIGPARG